MAEKRSGESSNVKPRLVDELVQKARLLALVNGILRTTLGAQSLPEVLLAVAPNLKEICPIDRLSVALYDPRRRLFQIPYVYTKSKVGESGERPLAYEDTPLSRVIETRKPLLWRDSRRDRPGSTDTAMLKRGPGCEAIFPLLAGELPFGTFQVACLEVDRLKDEHVRRIEELLPAIASAVLRFAGVMPPR